MLSAGSHLRLSNRRRLEFGRAYRSDFERREGLVGDGKWAAGGLVNDYRLPVKVCMARMTSLLAVHTFDWTTIAKSRHSFRL